MAACQQQAHPACIGAIHRLQARRRIRGRAHPQRIRLKGQFRALCRIHYPAHTQRAHRHLHVCFNDLQWGCDTGVRLKSDPCSYGLSGDRIQFCPYLSQTL